MAAQREFRHASWRREQDRVAVRGTTQADVAERMKEGAYCVGKAQGSQGEVNVGDSRHLVLRCVGWAVARRRAEWLVSCRGHVSLEVGQGRRTWSMKERA